MRLLNALINPCLKLSSNLSALETIASTSELFWIYPFTMTFCEFINAVAELLTADEICKVITRVFKASTYYTVYGKTSLF